MPPRRLTSTTKKRNKAALARKKRAESVRIGMNIERWGEIKIENDIEVATLLISRTLCILLIQLILLVNPGPLDTGNIMCETDGDAVFGDSVRREFYLREDCINVNHGSYGTAPRQVLKYKMRLEEELESHPDDWFRRKLVANFQTATNAVANVLHTHLEDTFFVQNATKGVNTVLKSYPLKPGDAFLVSNLCYTAVLHTSDFTVSRHEDVELVQVELKFPIENEESIIHTFEDTLRKHPNIRVAVIDHITSSTAIVMPVTQLTRIFHMYGVIVVIDGAHAPGQLPLNLPDIDADFYTGNFHKWMFAAKGCAVLWRNPKRLHAWFRPLITSNYHGNGLVREFGYEGTKDDSAYFSVTEAVAFCERLGGLEAVTRYNRELKERVVKYLAQSWGTEPLQVPASMEAPCMGLVRLPNIPGYDATSATLQEAERLCSAIYDKYGVQTFVRIVQGNFYIRLSVQVYNTFDDFKQLDKAVQEMSQTDV